MPHLVRVIWSINKDSKSYKPKLRLSIYNLAVKQFCVDCCRDRYLARASRAEGVFFFNIRFIFRGQAADSRETRALQSD